MTSKSIFDGQHISLNCWSAVKNISDWGDKKGILITLEFESTEEHGAMTLGASYVVNPDGSLAQGESVKVYSRLYKGESREQYTKTSHRYFSENIPDIVKSDIEVINRLFSDADPSVQRVF